MGLKFIGLALTLIMIQRKPFNSDPKETLLRDDLPQRATGEKSLF